MKNQIKKWAKKDFNIKVAQVTPQSVSQQGQPVPQQGQSVPQQGQSTLQQAPQEQGQENVDPQQQQKDFENTKRKVLPMAKKFITEARELYSSWNGYENEEQLSAALNTAQQSLQLLIASVQQGKRKMQMTTQQAVQQVKNPIGQENL